MTNEEIQRVMEFIIKQQESFAEGLAKSEARTGQIETASAALFNLVQDIGKAQMTLTETVTRLAEAQAQLVESLAHTDQRVNVLIDFLAQGRNGKSEDKP
jgi:hypothetical protein